MSDRAASGAFAVGTILLGILATAASAGAADPQAGPVVPDNLPVASDVRLAGDDTQTRMVVDFNQKIDVRVFTLANPYRVVVDLPQVTFEVPPKAGDRGRGLIKAFRFGLVRPGGSRIVVDLARPARVEKSSVLEGANGQPPRLVLELASIDRDAFMRTISLDNRLQETASPNPVPEAKSDPRPLVVIDPGHGGIDNGTKAARGETEKAIVLEFSLLLRDKIERSGKYRAVMTRSDDTFVPLAERVQFAHERKAALFVSIHADALPRGEGDAQGATVYTLSETASDAEAGRLAEAENRADVIAGVDLTAEPDDVADILIDLAQRETRSFSIQFARGLVAELRKSTRLHKNSLKSAGFRVLKAPDVPSVLVELGYVSNRQDIKSLTSADWRGRATESIMQAIDHFFSMRLAGAGRRASQN